MIIRQATIAEAKEVLCDHFIYDCISSDGAPKIEDYEPGEAFYVGGFIDGKIAALLVFHPKSNILWQVHVQVLKDYRARAMEFAEKGLGFFWNSAQSVIKLCAEIPDLYPNVLNFALKANFKIDGRIDNAYLKNGKLYSLYYLSLERDCYGMG